MPEIQLRVLAVAPLRPPGEAWEVGPELGEGARTVNGVKSVGEVKLENDFLVVSDVALAPLSNCVHSTVGAKRRSNAHLSRPEKLLGGVLDLLAKDFTNQPPNNFSHSDRAETTAFLFQGHKRSTREERGHRRGRIPVSKQKDNRDQLLQHSRTVPWSKGVEQVLGPEATGPRS